MSHERAIELVWAGKGLRFSGRGTLPETPTITIDGDGEAGPSPMITLLLAAAGCAASDVVLILKKMRVALDGLHVTVGGTRREENPRRYLSLRYRFEVRSPDVTQDQADRAVALSLEKYCSVAHSLAPDIAIVHEAVVVR
ncbi:MAG: OsmC family protein [Gemmatimonadales bacterium]